MEPDSDLFMRLRPIEPDDLASMYRRELNPRTSMRWRHRGATPSFDAFVRGFYDGLLACYACLDDRGTTVGYVSSYNADFRSGYAYIAAIACSADEGRGFVVRGVRTMTEYCFRAFPLRKVYVDAS